MRARNWPSWSRRNAKSRMDEPQTECVGRLSLGVVPENSIRRDLRGEAESAHHPMRCLRSSTCRFFATRTWPTETGLDSNLRMAESKSD
jgi:hypothetical protein